MVKSLTIKNDIKYLSRVNDLLQVATDKYDLNNTDFMNLKLALEEAVVNIISYAYPGETDKTITIQIEFQPKKMIITITDMGIPFDPTSKKEPDISLPLEERPIGGLGTYLVKQLMTNVTYKRLGGKNILTLIKDFQ